MRACGSDLDKVAQVKCYLKNGSDWEQYNQLYREYFKPPYPARTTIQNCLGKVRSKSKQARYGSVTSGGDFAETTFRVIAKYKRGIHLLAVPKTGRTHQIRVHLSEYGLPIFGDDLYESVGLTQNASLA